VLEAVEGEKPKEKWKVPPWPENLPFLHNPPPFRILPSRWDATSRPFAKWFGLPPTGASPAATLLRYFFFFFAAFFVVFFFAAFFFFAFFFAIIYHLLSVSLNGSSTFVITTTS
jgi:hypothetical protein